MISLLFIESSEVESVNSACLYGGPLAYGIWQLKFNGRADLAHPLGALLRRSARQRAIEADVIVPVPLHPVRLAERGYNQSALLAQALCDDLSAPLESTSLLRMRHTAPQRRLTAAARRINVCGAFALNKGGRLRGKRVLLIDDVCTTGATLSACRKVILTGGATDVVALTLALADRGR
ncbi:ComF family protein [Endomicrobium sp. AH-315-J14]|nr:ComF family protein [Endomicrobium sp. AH-315-J14]